MATVYYIRRKLAPNRPQTPMTNETPESNAPEKESDSTKPEPSLEKSEKESPSSLQPTIEPLLTNLLYPSESDEPVSFVQCYLKQKSPLTGSQIEEWLMLPPSVFVEEIPEAEFWKPVTKQEEWYGDDEKKRTEAFLRLQQEIEKHLTGRQVFRVGDSEIDVYLLGRTPEGDRAGLKTKVVET